MSDFNLTNKVVQDNDMIVAINKLDKTTFKIFEMAVSCIDSRNPRQEVYLSKQDIFRFFEHSSEARYTRMENALKRLSQQGIILELPDHKKRLVNVTSYLEWGTNDNQDEVAIRFNDLIMPYLIDLKSNFTQYNITEIKNLNSKYSLILFKLFMMKHNQGQQHPEVSMNELRILTATENEYDRFGDFDTRVLKTSIKEINKNTTLNVSYEKIARKGRKITSIKFHIIPKDTSKAIDVSKNIEEPIKGPYNDLYETFSTELSISMSESEKTLIRSLNDQYGQENLIIALRKAIVKGTASLRYIEKSLRSLDISNKSRSIVPEEQQLSFDDIDPIKNNVVTKVAEKPKSLFYKLFKK